MPAYDPFGLSTQPGGANYNGGAQTIQPMPKPIAQPNSGGPFAAGIPTQGAGSPGFDPNVMGPWTPGWGAMWGGQQTTGGTPAPQTGAPNGSLTGGGMPIGDGSGSFSTQWQEMLSKMGSGAFGNLSGFNLNPQLQSALTFALGQGMNNYNPNSQYYSGQLTPNLTPDDIQAQNMLRQLSGQLTGQTSSYYDLLANAMGRATGTAPSGTLQPAIDATAKDMTQQYQQVGGVLDNTRQQFIGAGQYGSAKQQVSEGINNKNFSDVLAKTIASMRLNDQQQGQQQAGSLLGQMPAMSQLQTLPANLLSAIGGQNREQQGNLNNEGFNKWAFNLYEPQRQLSNLFGNISGALPLGGVQQSQTIQPDWYSQLMQQMMGTNLSNAQGGSQGGGAGSSILGALLGAGGLYSLFK